MHEDSTKVDKDAQAFFNLKDANQVLYHTCKNFTRLSFLDIFIKKLKRFE